MARVGSLGLSSVLLALSCAVACRPEPGYRCVTSEDCPVGAICEDGICRLVSGGADAAAGMDQDPVDRLESDVAQADAAQLDRGLLDTGAWDGAQLDGAAADGAGGDAASLDAVGIDAACAASTPQAWCDPGSPWRFAIALSRVPNGYTVNWQPDAAELAALTEKMNFPSGLDLRVYWSDGAACIELDRYAQLEGPGAAEFRFKIQEPSGYEGGDDRYSFYTGNPYPASPLEDPRNVYYMYEDFTDLPLGSYSGSELLLEPQDNFEVVDHQDGRGLWVSGTGRHLARFVGVDLREALLLMGVRFNPSTWANLAGLFFRSSSATPVSLTAYSGSMRRLSGQVGITSYDNGVYQGFMDSNSAALQEGVWYSFATWYLGDSATVVLDEQTYPQVTLADEAGRGTGLVAYDPNFVVDVLLAQRLVSPPPTVALGSAELYCP